MTEDDGLPPLTISPFGGLGRVVRGTSLPGKMVCRLVGRVTEAPAGAGVSVVAAAELFKALQSAQTASGCVLGGTGDGQQG